MKRLVPYLAGMVAACAGQARAHFTEFFIGRNAAGQLKVKIDGPFPVQLNTSVFPGFPGWAEAEPGFESLPLDLPAEDLFVLPASADIAFTLVSIDPHLQFLNRAGTAMMQAGQDYYLGQPFFDIHPVFNIAGGVPGQVHTMKIIIKDLSNTFAPTGEITISFVSSPCYANCDASQIAPVMTANDFVCFVNKFAAGDPYANCDESTGAQALSANDFICFINEFTAKCHH